MSKQSQFDFESAHGESGHDRWLAVRRVAAKDLACKLNLPLGHPVEIWLRGDVRLRGVLRLKEEVLFLEESAVNHLGLVVDNVAFTISEMDSCVRLD